MNKLCDNYNFTAITVSFNESSYSIAERGAVVITVVLSNPSSTDITVTLITTDDSAVGEYSLAT